jgi:hypothetical protein
MCISTVFDGRNDIMGEPEASHLNYLLTCTSLVRSFFVCSFGNGSSWHTYEEFPKDEIFV